MLARCHGVGKGWAVASVYTGVALGGALPTAPPAIPAGRIAAIASTYKNVIPFATPQSQVDQEVAQRNSASMMYPMESATHMAMVSGAWSNPATWGGTTAADVPGMVPGQTYNVMTMAGCHELLFDVEMPAGAIIRYLMTDARTTFKYARAPDTTLRVFSAMFMGPVDRGHVGDPMLWSTTSGRLYRSRLIYDWPSDIAPDTTAKGGSMFMGPERAQGETCVERFEAFPPAIVNYAPVAGSPHGGLEAVVFTTGQEWIPAPLGHAALNWPVGSEVEIADTSLAPQSGDSADAYRNANVDTTFTGSNAGALPGTIGYETNYGANDPNRPGFSSFDSVGFRLQHQCERRIIREWAADGLSFRVDALTYNHRAVRDTLPGTSEVVITGCPVVFLDGSILTQGLHLDTSTFKRAHEMNMHGDAQVRGVRYLDMGRSSPDVTMVRPPYPYRDGWTPNDFDTKANVGGPSQINPLNVRGRYVKHFHELGSYPSSMMSVVEQCVATHSIGAPIIPSWCFVAHGSRHAFERVTVSGFRAAAFVTEWGSEIGHWSKLTALRGVGNGLAALPKWPCEQYESQNGSNGVAFEMQARQIATVGCWAIACNYVQVFIKQEVNIYPNRIPAREALRVVNPVVTGHFGSVGGLASLDDAYSLNNPALAQSYGVKQEQIVPQVDVRGYSCLYGITGFHRQFTYRNDPVMGQWKRPRFVGTRLPFKIVNYAWNYLIRDAIMFDCDEGAKVGEPSTRQNFSNVAIRSSSARGVIDAGSILNYLGSLTNVSVNGVPQDEGANSGTAAFTGDINAVFGNGVYGPYTDLGGGRMQVRRWWSRTRAQAITDALPTTASNMGLGALNPEPNRARPFMHAFAGEADTGITWSKSNNPSTTTTTVIDWNGGTNQLQIFAALYDNAGTDVFGAWVNPETYPSNMSAAQTYTAPLTTPLQYVEFNGCFHDSDGKWKVALHWPLTDRAAMGDDPDFYIQTMILELLNYPADVLAKYEVANADTTKPSTNYLLEAIPSGAIVLPTAPPVIVSPDSASATYPGGAAMFLPLKAAQSNVAWTLGGADAGSFERVLIGGVYGIQVKSNGRLLPGTYHLTVTATDPLTGLATTAPLTLTGDNNRLFDKFDYVGDVFDMAATTGLSYSFGSGALHSNGDGTATLATLPNSNQKAIGVQTNSQRCRIKFNVDTPGHTWPIFMGFGNGDFTYVLIHGDCSVSANTSGSDARYDSYGVFATRGFDTLMNIGDEICIEQDPADPFLRFYQNGVQRGINTIHRSTNPGTAILFYNANDAFDGGSISNLRIEPF